MPPRPRRIVTTCHILRADPELAEAVPAAEAVRRRAERCCPHPQRVSQAAGSLEDTAAGLGFLGAADQAFVLEG